MNSTTAPEVDLLPKRASLLGIPRELRLMIFSHVCSSGLADGRAVESWKDDDSSRSGFKSVPNFSEHPLKIPWLGLTLACRATATELASVKIEAGTTYSLNLEGRASSRRLGATTWRRLPCAPNRARFLSVRYNGSSGSHPR